MSVKIILLNASAGAGKDTYYNEFKRINSDKEVMRFAFADAIKGLMVEFFGWDTVNKEGIWRTRMQKIGKYFRELDKNVWIDYTVDSINTFLSSRNETLDWFPDEEEVSKDVVVFITDCRFDNEVIRTKELFPNNTVIVERLHRDFKSNLTEEQKKDISELGISDHLVDVETYLKNREVLSNEESISKS